MQKNRQHDAVILVVADDEEIRDGIQALLEADGHCICPVRNEKDAVDAALRNPPDLVLLVSLGQSDDEMMASARRIRLLAGVSDHIPVVMFCITTISQGAEIAVGENMYATRPDNFNQLRLLLERLLDRRCLHSGSTPLK